MEENLVLSYDGQLYISVGKSRKVKVWKEEQVTYSRLLKNLSVPRFTKETMEEYRAFEKGLQDNIKDVGGFVGGRLKEGKRGRATVVDRQILTLDIDYGARNMVEKIKERFLGGFAVYSTHKHTKDNPRLRLIIPLSRAVSPEEYEAVGRFIAKDIGMDYFDDSTFEPSRLMYWQSTSCDGEYVFHYEDKTWVNPKEVLDLYEDWTDMSKWPYSSRVTTRRTNTSKIMKRPQEKQGAEGLFCTVYNVPRAIDTFLNHIYEPATVAGSGEERYSYKLGSTCGGMVIYEGGDFAYSFHGTDPAGGKLYNSYHLVRLHLFGALDEGISSETSIDKRPSGKAMKDFVLKDEAVKEFLGQGIMDKAQEFFKVPLKKEEKGDNGWMSKLEMDNSGKYCSTTVNVVTIFENDPYLKGNIAYNEFSHRVMIRGDLPWHQVINKEEGDPWEEWDDAFVRYYMESVYGIYTPMKIADGFSIIAEKKKYHPIRDYLNSLSWDGVKRLDKLFIDFLGGENSDYVKTVTRKIFTAAVHRVFDPGKKFDWMLVLVGKQGIGKSHILNLMGKSWFSDSFTTVLGKEAYEQLQDGWIIEVGELSALKKAEEEAVKQFISKSADNYRMAYARRVSKVPRQCVFFGTTNEMNFLKDTTGNRRFWPVMVGVNRIERNLFKELTPAMVDLYWAEAMALYKAGENLHLSEGEERVAAEIQEIHRENNTKEGPIRRFLETKLPREWKTMSLIERRQYLSGSDFESKWIGTEDRTKVCAMEVWMELFGGDIKTLLPHMAKEINDIIKRVEGWEEYTQGRGRLRFGFHGVQKAFIRSGQ